MKFDLVLYFIKFHPDSVGTMGGGGLVPQTGKYVVRVENLPRASKLPCAQRPKYATSCEEAVRGWFSMRANLRGKCLPRAENKLSSLACPPHVSLRLIF